MTNLRAYSKVNLILKVYPKKINESKHRIKSLMVLNRSIYDNISITTSSQLKVKYMVNGKRLSFFPCNITKAVQYMHHKYNCPAGWNITVEKQIPIQSGLGGSSADAACIINFLLSHLPNKVSLNLKEIALTLGSDIPFFLAQYNYAIVEGYGNVVNPYKNTLPTFQVIKTGIKCNTSKIYRLLDQTPNYKSLVSFTSCLKNIYSEQIHNDLEPLVSQAYPKIKKWKKNGILLSGSGGCLIKLNKSVKNVEKGKTKDNKDNKIINNTTSPHYI